MESKTIMCLAFFCIMQAVAIFLLASCTHWLVFKGINSKPMNPFWGVNPYFSTVDPDLYPIISGIQLRIKQIQVISKSSIGLNVGLASKNIGLATSQAKINVKSVINSVQNNPNNTKDCLALHKTEIDQINTESKNQLSFCSKSSQIQLKTNTQVQKELSYQAAVITNELNLAISQCQLANPLPTDKPAVIECVSTKVEELKEKVTTLEQTVLDTIQAVDTNIAQIVDSAKLCIQNVQDAVQQQADQIAGDLEACNNATLTI